MDMLQSLGMSKDLIADLLINIVSIIVLYLVVKKLAYNPVKKFLVARTERIEAEKAEVSKTLSEATEMKEKYDELLKDCENAKADAIKEELKTAVANEIAAKQNAKSPASLATNSTQFAQPKTAEDEFVAGLFDK
jgi:F-type H+-transporting ATPase subunit b